MFAKSLSQQFELPVREIQFEEGQLLDKLSKILVFIAHTVVVYRIEL